MTPALTSLPFAYCVRLRVHLPDGNGGSVRVDGFDEACRWLDRTPGAWVELIRVERPKGATDAEYRAAKDTARANVLALREWTDERERERTALVGA